MRQIIKSQVGAAYFMDGPYVVSVVAEHVPLLEVWVPEYPHHCTVLHCTTVLLYCTTVLYVLYCMGA